MSRLLTNKLVEQLNSREFNEVVLQLLTVTHSQGTRRFVKGFKSVTSNGNVFSPSYFDLQLVPEGSDTPPTVSLVADVGDTDLIRVLRTESVSPRIFLSYALASDPDFIEIGPLEFEVETATINGTQVNVKLAYEPVLNLRIPTDFITPTKFPGAF